MKRVSIAQAPSEVIWRFLRDFVPKPMSVFDLQNFSSLIAKAAAKAHAGHLLICPNRGNLALVGG